MKCSNNKNYILFAAMVLLPLSIEQVQAGYDTASTHKYQDLTQRHEDMQQFELSARQARSKVEHTLVNYLLGQTIDQYLDFGVDDVTSRKSFKRLKLRLNRHRAILLYQHHFY